MCVCAHGCEGGWGAGRGGRNEASQAAPGQSEHWDPEASEISEAPISLSVTEDLVGHDLTCSWKRGSPGPAAASSMGSTLYTVRSDAELYMPSLK